MQSYIPDPKELIRVAGLTKTVYKPLIKEYKLIRNQEIAFRNYTEKNFFNN